MQEKIDSLKVELEAKIPEFVKSCEVDSSSRIIMTQAAFAVDGTEEEYNLFGKAIKYAGLTGHIVEVINHDEAK